MEVGLKMRRYVANLFENSIRVGNSVADALFRRRAPAAWADPGFSRTATCRSEVWADTRPVG